MYSTVLGTPRRKRKKKKIAPSDAIKMVDRLGQALSGNLRRDQVGTFGTSIFRSDALDEIAKPRINLDIIFGRHETELERIRRERKEEIEQNHLQKGL
jgi:hypothetical protein